MIRRYVTRSRFTLVGYAVVDGGWSRSHVPCCPCVPQCSLCVLMSHVDQWIQSVATLHTKHTHTHYMHVSKQLVSYPHSGKTWYLKFTLLGCGKDQWLDIVNMYIVLHCNKILCIYCWTLKSYNNKLYCIDYYNCDISIYRYVESQHITK